MAETSKGRAVTVGTFDGVHRGHLEVLRTVRERAAADGLEPMVVTFDRHPLEVIAPGCAPKMIIEPDERDLLLMREGMLVERVAFTEEVRRFTAAEWMQRLSEDYGARELVLGYDNTFGSDGRGKSEEEFREIGSRLGMRVCTASAVAGCSSSAVRAAVSAGDMELARRILGRPFALVGTVEGGRRIGRTIGIPTANLHTGARQLVPAPGVYAARVLADGRDYPAVVNVGTNPTVSDDGKTHVEAHLIGFGGDLYGSRIEILFGERLRGEKKFSSLEELRRQINVDIREVCARCPEK